MSDAIHIQENTGFKCDAEGCDYRSDPVDINSDLSGWVGKPCPKCGENLCTEEDFEQLQVFIMSVQAANDVMNMLAEAGMELPDDGPRATARVIFKDGKMNLGEIKPVTDNGDSKET